MSGRPMTLKEVMESEYKSPAPFAEASGYTGGMRECLRRTLRRLESRSGHDGEPEMELMRRDIRRVLGRKTKAERSEDALYCKSCAMLKSQCECWDNVSGGD